MSKTDQICDDCRTKVDAVFNAATGTRDLVLINGMREVTDCCFVADEIHFTGNSQLVFAPTLVRERKTYCREYFVVCRKIVIQGGKEGKDFTPCSPDDPGHMYSGNNVITWQDRLKSAADAGDVSPAKAARGTSRDRDTWSDVGQGNNGASGGPGDPGLPGQQGAAGFSPTPSVTVLALEVEAGVSDHLTIDFDGQNGGKGGLGQEGGDGGDGMGGRGGDSDTSWPGEGCDRQPGDGGDGGNGGAGGTGGRGGTGGNAGNIVAVSTPANISGGGVFLGTHIHYVNDGGDGGKGGKGNKMGVGGAGGKKGKPKTEHCEDPDPGVNGEPSFLNRPDAADGPGGANGGGGGLSFEGVEIGTCADQIPLPSLTITSVTPNTGARGATVPVTITGFGFAPTALIDVKGIGVPVSLLTVVNTTQITCTFTIGNLAPTTARDVEVKNSVPHHFTLPGAFTVTP